MAGRVEGKVALITGAARGQGRSHAVRLAQEGADIIALDICADVETVSQPGPTEADLAETVAQVEALDRRIVSRVADVRDLAALQEVVAAGLSEFGRIDILAANAGIGSFGSAWELDEAQWQAVIDVNLTGVWKSTKAVIPQMLEQGSGSIVLTSSTAGLAALPNLAHYTAAKHGVVGLMRTLAIELAPHNIRCNSVHPTTVSTPMVHNPDTYALFMGGKQGATREEAIPAFTSLNALPVPWVEAVDISNAVLYLASDEARYVTGTTHVVDAGSLSPYKLPHQ
jgi:SDR family mycofactocin-dependent oxidoreductase